MTGMSSKTLSAVLEKQIHHLCLRDFPCGYGSWKKTKGAADSAGLEETGALLDLLSCTRSPWWHDESWSPQAAALRQLGVLTPECLTTDFIYNYFTTIRIVNKDVAVIDKGMLKFSKLRELVLSVNKISKISVENLPSTLKVLELRNNSLSSLNSLTKHPPPHLQYLGLGSNSLGSHQDVSHLTGSHWPHLVCLDLSDCQFQDQRSLLEALSTLSSLKTLVLEGNPFTLASSYPGVTVDSLPRLHFLDALRISPEQRCRFKGLADMRDLIMDQASSIVRVGRIRGLQDPLSLNENHPDAPVVSYSYFITYEFLSHQTSVSLPADDNPENSLSAAELQSNTSCERQARPQTQHSGVKTVETHHDTVCVSRHHTQKLVWSDNMDFSDTQTYVVNDLGALKKFLSEGLHLFIEEEKVLSHPAASDSVKEKKDRKAKDPPVKPGSAKGKKKDKKKESVPELVADAPIRRLLGSVHVPLQSLVTGRQQVDILCDFGVLHNDFQDPGEETKDNKKQKSPVGCDTRNKASLKGKINGRKDHEVGIHTDGSSSTQLQPVTVEFSVEVERWQCASEAQQLLHPQTISPKPV